MMSCLFAKVGKKILFDILEVQKEKYFVRRKMVFPILINQKITFFCLYLSLLKPGV